jgi:hypothetical protein
MGSLLIPYARYILDKKYFICKLENAHMVVPLSQMAIVP